MSQTEVSDLLQGIYSGHTGRWVRAGESRQKERRPETVGEKAACDQNAEMLVRVYNKTVQICRTRRWSSICLCVCWKTLHLSALPDAVSQGQLGCCNIKQTLTGMSWSAQLTLEWNTHSSRSMVLHNTLWLLKWGQWALLAPICFETALPVLPPGQSISAEFGTSSRGRERARRIKSNKTETTTKKRGILAQRRKGEEKTHYKI